MNNLSNKAIKLISPSIVFVVVSSLIFAVYSGSAYGFHENRLINSKSRASAPVRNVITPPPNGGGGVGNPQTAPAGFGVCSIHDAGITDGTDPVYVLLAAKAAGCGYVRIDVAFNTIMKNGQVNQTVLSKFGNFAITATGMGVGVIPCLLPDGDISYGHWYSCGWFGLGRCYQDAQVIEPAWQNFVTAVAREFGPAVTYYQVLNEPNDFISDQNYDPLNLISPGLGLDGDLNAITAARQSLKSQNPTALVIVNVNTAMDFNWVVAKAFPSWLAFLEALSNSIDVAAIDNYPGSWVATSSLDWSALVQLFAAVDTPGNPLYNKQTAVMETGYPTDCVAYLPSCNNLTNAAQQAYILSALPVIHTLAVVQNAAAHDGGGRFLFVGWYELMDSGGSWADFNGDWGVLREGSWKKFSSLEKPGFNSLYQEMMLFQ